MRLTCTHKCYLRRGANMECRCTSQNGCRIVPRCIWLTVKWRKLVMRSMWIPHHTKLQLLCSCLNAQDATPGLGRRISCDQDFDLHGSSCTCILSLSLCMGVSGVYTLHEFEQSTYVHTIQLNIPRYSLIRPAAQIYTFCPYSRCYAAWPRLPSPINRIALHYACREL